MSVEARYCYITINALRVGFSTQDIIASDFIFLVTCTGLTDTKGKDVWEICVQIKQKQDAKLNNVGQIKWL